MIKSKSWKLVLLWVTIALVLSIVALPLLWLVRLALIPPYLLLSEDLRWIFIPDFTSYLRIFQEYEFIKYLTNSLIIVAGSITLSLLLGIPAAYSLARFRFRGKSSFAVSTLFLHAMPPIAMIIPLFIMFRNIGLLNTRFAVIVGHTILTLPLAIWLLRGFVMEIPPELEEAAMIDGCTRLEAIRHVLLPIIAPGIAATVVLTWIYSWNDFIYAMILGGRNARTLPVMTAAFITHRATAWDCIASAGTIILLPPLVVGIFVQRYLVRGLAGGAIK